MSSTVTYEVRRTGPAISFLAFARSRDGKEKIGRAVPNEMLTF